MICSDLQCLCCSLTQTGPFVPLGLLLVGHSQFPWQWICSGYTFMEVNSGLHSPPKFLLQTLELLYQLLSSACRAHKPFLSLALPSLYILHWSSVNLGNLVEIQAFVLCSCHTLFLPQLLSFPPQRAAHGIKGACVRFGSAASALPLCQTP